MAAAAVFDRQPMTFSFEDIPGDLPADTLPQNPDITSLPAFLAQVLENFDHKHLVKDVMWKDWLSLTGEIRTYHGQQAVGDLWKKVTTKSPLRDVATGPGMLMNFVPGSAWVMVPFTYNFTQTNGLTSKNRGYANLVFDQPTGEWKIWCLISYLQSFDGHGDPDVPVFTETPTSDIDASGVISTIIVGGGQSGLAQAARCKALGLSHLIIEKQREVGSAWWGRYDSVTQHSTKYYNSLPFEYTWEPEEPDLLPGQAVAAGFRRFVDKFGLNLWLNSTVEKCSWDEDKKLWKVTIKRAQGTQTVYGKNLVMAIGAGFGEPNLPTYKGQDVFKGDYIPHPAYKNARGFKGKKTAVVVGAGTMAHDIAQDLHDSGINVTLIQRNRTTVFPLEWVVAIQNVGYNKHIPVHEADFNMLTAPDKIGGVMMDKMIAAQRPGAQEKFDALERAGFRVDREASLMGHIYQRFGGYYIDIGTSQLIADGKIKVKSGVPISHLDEDGVNFEDGDRIQADIFVVSTGFKHDYRSQIAPFLDEDVASKMDTYWGLDKDGDVRGAMKTMYPGSLWLMGGGALLTRYYSRFVALQIQQTELMSKA